MEIPDRNLLYPTPLSVCFHCWEDQCSPLLQFSCFVSIKWSNYLLARSHAWSDPMTSSVLFGGTHCGTIVAYKICSQEGCQPSMKPLCLIFGHHSRITSLVPCDPFIYRSCVASLSTDGTLSLISVEDLTIISNSKSLFSENSHDLAPHESNSCLMLASQAFGTVEIADVSNSTLVLRISGFTSIITSIESHGTLHAVSCADGSIGVFSINAGGADCIYNIKQSNHAFSHAILSPKLGYLLLVTKDEWFLYDSDRVLFSETISSPEDAYTGAKWVDDTMFYIITLSGRVEVWRADSESEAQIFDRMSTSHGIYYISSLSENKTIEPMIVTDKPLDTRHLHELPTLVFAIENTQKIGFAAETVVTPEGFIIYSPSPSFLVLKSEHGDCECDLSSFFTAKIRCRCALGDPIIHEARISVEDEVFLDNEKIGEHRGANLLFSAPDGKKFFSMSSDGSVKAWGDKLLASFHDLCEPVKEVTYIQKKQWLVVIGKLSAFSVISVQQLCSILLCSGHNSPIVEVMYSNGLFHSRCESSSIYTWNIDGQLVSKRKSKKMKRIGQITEIANSPMSHSEPAIHDLTIKCLDAPVFSKIVPLIMPSCQTFAVVLDVFDFLLAFKNYELLNIQNDPAFLPLILLWRCHVGGSRVKLSDKNMGLLGSFTYAIAGDNYTVTLPFSLKIQKQTIIKETTVKQLATIPKTKNRSSSVLIDVKKNTPSSLKRGNTRNPKEPFDKFEMTSAVAFEFTPLLSAVHSVAASAIAQCFVGVKNDENLSIISSVSQTTTAMALSMAVTPSPLVLANYMLFPSSNLRSVVINVIQEIMNNLTEEESSRIIFKVEHNFPKWSVVLAFVFIHCLKYKLSGNFGKKCANNIFPVIFEFPETLDLMLNCFEHFVSYIEDFQHFFIQMLDATISKKVPNNKIAGFGIVKPLEFFDVAVMTPLCPELCEALFERWMTPDREMLLNFISHVLAASRNGISIDLNRIFEIMACKISYFGASKAHLVFGSNNGEIIVFSRETTLITWKQQITKHPISCLSVSPSGARFIVIVLEPDYTITWVSLADAKSKETFRIDTVEKLPQGAVVSDFIWKSEGKVILMNLGKKIFECLAPNMTFFQRLKKK